MNLLLDTHAFLWLDSSPQELSSTAQAGCMDSSNRLWFSAASVWELQMKLQSTRLTLRDSIQQTIERQQQGNGLRILDITMNHALQAGSLPLHHKDPFDRMIIAQALCEGWVIVGKDPQFRAYGAVILW